MRKEVMFYLILAAVLIISIIAYSYSMKDASKEVQFSPSIEQTKTKSTAWVMIVVFMLITIIAVISVLSYQIMGK